MPLNLPLFVATGIPFYSRKDGSGIFFTEPKDERPTPTPLEDWRPGPDDDPVEHEADVIERLAIEYGNTYYGKRWDDLTPDQRLGLRMRARRYLGL